MGRPLSPSQIPQKNISMPSKLHKTTSVGWQRTSGSRKSRPLPSKTGVPEEEDRKKDHEKILEEIIVENFPKWGRK